MGQSVATIGQSVIIKGELSAREDLTIEGQVDGKVELNDNVLTIGPNGRIEADVLGKVISVMGTVHGNIRATEVINLRETARVDGALVAPRVGITEGASFRGQIDMQQSQAPKSPTAGGDKGTQIPPRPVGATRR